jgi:hypothetical protein
MIEGTKHIPLAEFSCFHLPKPEGVLMVIQSYFDSSGKIDDPNARYLTLAGYSGNKQAWSDFEVAWGAVLKAHGAKYFHCKEAVHRRGGFKDWSEEAVRALMKDLIGALGKIDRQGLLGFASTVVLDDHKEVKRTKIASLRSPEHLCLDHCVGCVLRQSELIHDVEIFFDWHEPFDHKLRVIWKKKAWWWRYVSHIGPISSIASTNGEPGGANVYAIQAADLLAWLFNRHHTKGPEDEWGMLLIGMYLTKDVRRALFDKKALLEVFDGNGHYKPGVEIPAAPIRCPRGEPPFARRERISGKLGITWGRTLRPLMATMGWITNMWAEVKKGLWKKRKGQSGD